MHPVLTFKSWAHAHHGATRHNLVEQLSQWIHSEAFWPVAGIIFALGAVAALLYLTVHFGPMTGNDITLRNPAIFWTQ